MPETNSYGRKAVLRALGSALLIFLFLIAVGPVSPSANAQGSLPKRQLITGKNGQARFIIGANYEGPTDRAWQMWDTDKFDETLIDADFARARAFGINTLRIFIQKPIRDDIIAGDFTKLDRTLELAKKNGLQLIVTFTDWAEPDLARASALNARIAGHLTSDPTVLAYDTKNEPQFSDIAGAIYPTGTVALPLQSPETLAIYGDRVPRASIGDYRRGEGKSLLPARMSDDQAYLMANYYKLYVEFLNAGAAWVNAHAGTTTLDYMDSTDSSSWTPFIAALDGTLSAWVGAQMAGVQLADPGRPLTVGYSNIVLAKMPSNTSLGFQSLHRFTAHGYAGLSATFRVLDNLSRSFPGEPLLLEEFGYPGQVNAPGGGVQGFDPRTTANLESAVWAYLFANGYAGGMKWMLNNFPAGANPAENSYGLFDNGGAPKLTAHLLKQLSDVLAAGTRGSFAGVSSGEAYAVNYSYEAPDTLVAGGKSYTGTNVLFNAAAPSNLIVGTRGGAITLFATDVSTADLNLPGIFGVGLTDIGQINLVGQDAQGNPYTPQAPTLQGNWLHVSLVPLYRYKLTVVPRAVEKAAPRPDALTVYFPQTGHNLGAEFLRYWQTRGGLATFGYPLTEPFTEGGNIVQYFERNRFELHTENTEPYNVLLGRLGAAQTENRRFSVVEAFQSGRDHRFFPETGHSLHFAFLGYWNRNGGLAQFGYPISEELRETSRTDAKEYTVQYFERARFEYHPELGKSGGEVLLGLLGVATMQSKGWLP